MPKKINKNYDNFMKELLSLERVETKYHWMPEFKDQEKILNYWMALSDRAKIAVIKDSRWNHYPRYRYSYSLNDGRSFGGVIDNLVKTIVYSSGDKAILKNHSQGIFAYCSVGHMNAKEKIIMAKRLVTSKDQRLAAESCNILPANIASRVLKDKVSRSRSGGRRISSAEHRLIHKLIQRVGLVSCYKEFLPRSIGDARLTWNGRRSLAMATRDDVSYLIDEIKSGPAIINKDILGLVVAKMSAEEIIFSLDLLNDQRTEEVVSLILQMST